MTRKAAGFTLIEAVAVIVITGIIAGVVAVFIAKPVAGYVDATRRVMLADMADTALRRIGREVRGALPNSVRIAGTCCYLEFVPTSDGVRYRAESYSGTDTATDFTAPSTYFDVFSASTLSAAVGDFLVIFNTGQSTGSSCASLSGADVYEGCNRRTITGLPTAISGSTTYTKGISFTSTRTLPFDSPSHRVHLVPSTGPVTFACEAPTAAETSAGVQGSLVLRRYWNYNNGSSWNTSQVAPPSGGSSAILADSVSSCAFTYTSGVTRRNGLLVLSLTLTRSGESVNLYHEIHVDNQP